MTQKQKLTKRCFYCLEFVWVSFARDSFGNPITPVTMYCVGPCLPKFTKRNSSRAYTDTNYCVMPESKAAIGYVILYGRYLESLFNYGS